MRRALGTIKRRGLPPHLSLLARLRAPGRWALLPVDSSGEVRPAALVRGPGHFFFFYERLCRQLSQSY